MLRILAIGTDRSLLDPESSSFARQKRYYQDAMVDIILLCSGPAAEVRKGGIHVMTAGGKNKGHALLRALALINRLALRSAYDLVSVQDPHWSGFVGHFAVFRSHAPLYLQDHSGFFGRKPFSLIERVFARYSWFLARHAARIRVVSRRSLEGLVQRGISADRIDVIPVYSAVTRTSERTHREKAKILFSVGRLEPEKGYEACLRAWALLPELEGAFVIAGDGRERRRYERLCEELGITSRVRFVGFQKQLDSYWKDADVYIQPSFFEGWGRTFLEAAAWHLPIIAGPVGLVGEVLESNASVLLMEPGNPLSIAQAIKRLWSDKHLRIQFGETAFQAGQQHGRSEQELIDAIRAGFVRAVAGK
jgi:glycosyltransferase involved in cell wall biosynthesis